MNIEREKKRIKSKKSKKSKKGKKGKKSKKESKKERKERKKEKRTLKRALRRQSREKQDEKDVIVLANKEKEYIYLVPQNDTKMPSSWQNNIISWLTNFDIYEVMQNYVKKNKDFHFLMPPPIDFDKKDEEGRCLVSDLCQYNLEDLCEKYKYFGTVFNTSQSHESGQHWIALFVHIPKRHIYYYDSFGDPMPNEVKKLVERFQEQGNNYLRKQGEENVFEIFSNKTQHQSRNTECGIYCMYFIFCMLENEPFSEYCNKPIMDQLMICFRSKFFEDKNNIYKQSCEIFPNSIKKTIKLDDLMILV